MHQNVAELLWRASRDAAHPAVIGRDGTADYAVLRARASAFARALLARDIAPGDRVAVLLERGVDAVAAFFGTLAAGAAAVVINETLRPRQIEHILSHADARMLITSADMLARQPRSLQSHAALLDAAAVPAGDLEHPVAREARDLAQIVYTSGSTGQPKGVMVAHGNLAAAARAVVAYLELGPSDRIASLLPLSFVYGMSQVLCAVAAGATLVVERSPLAEDIVAVLRARHATVLAAVPPLWAQLLASPAFRDHGIPTLRVMTNAGGHLPVPSVRALRAAVPGARLFLMYGLTEVLRSTYLPADEVDRRPDSIGVAIPEAQVAVLRDDGTPAPPGEVGELVHAGPTVTLGYWKDPALTERVFRPHPAATAAGGGRVVYSGDLVKRDAQGFLYYVGRRDRIIKTLGYRVGPDEIADVLYASGEVLEAAVTGEPDEQRGTRIVAHIVLTPGGALDRVRTFCARELPRYMQPARYVMLDALPRLSSGKHDIAALSGALTPPAGDTRPRAR